MNFLYLAPPDMFTLQAAVSGSVLNATYLDDWLCDGLPGRPVHSGTTGPSWTVTGAAKPVNLVAALNWNLDAGVTITSSGGLPTMTMPAYLGRVPLNPFAVNAPAGVLTDIPGVTSITVACTNGSQVIAGEYVAGKARELQRPILRGGKRAYDSFNIHPTRQQIGNVHITRKEVVARRFSGETVLTLAGMEAVIAWYESTNDNELMSVIVPDPLRNDAWAVKFERFDYTKNGPDEYEVSLSLVEIPRKRW